MKRRTFLQAAGVGMVAPFCIGRAYGQDRVAPSNRINMGFVGLGGLGFHRLMGFAREADVHVAAICDVSRLHYRDNEWGTGQPFGREAARQALESHYSDVDGYAVEVYSDYRELCANPEIDAVMIATPDHWHAAITLEAIRQGKDVYCEKPVTHLFGEGLRVIDAVRKTGAVFQTGSQQRSSDEFRRAANIVRNGHLGPISSIEVGLQAGYSKLMGDATEQEPPETLDYDFWCGPSQRLPYMRARHHRWWRAHTAYGGGNIMDWIGHHNDIAHWAMDWDSSGPTRVEATGWTYLDTDIYDTPEHYEIQCAYAGGVTTSISDRHAQGVKWIGPDGWLYVDRRKLEASDDRWLAPEFDPGPERVYESRSHIRNFLDCCKSREACVAPAETGHRSITPGHLGFLSQAIGSPVHWDPSTQTVKDNADADSRLRAVHYRDTPYIAAVDA